MAQAQKVVPVDMLEGAPSHAIATGNNAAWICVCRKHPDPLIGRTGSLNGPTPAMIVECPKCNRKYFVEPVEKSQGAVGRVVEVK